MATDAEAMLAEPVDTGNLAMIEELREILNDLRAKTEEKLAALAG